MRTLAALLLASLAACSVLPPAGHQRDVTTVGDYRLELSVDQARYARGEETLLQARLTYTGPRASTTVGGSFELVSFAIQAAATIEFTVS